MKNGAGDARLQPALAWARAHAAAVRGYAADVRRYAADVRRYAADVGGYAADVRRYAADKVFPTHPWFLLGELALFSFLVLVGTGIYLALFYEASGQPVTYDGSYEALAGLEVPAAYASVLDITFEHPGGAWVRQVHHWAALVFVATIVLHAGRVFFTGAFRRPRRLNWMLGLTLLALSMASGYFGLSLPYDLLGGTGARIGHAFAVSIPVIGPGLADLVFAGEFGNPAMIHRFWLIHVIILPLLIAAVLGLHLTLIATQTHTQFPSGPLDHEPSRADNVTGSRAWPGYALKTIGLALMVAGALAVMGAVFQIAPIWLYGPFDPSSSTVPAQPDWYLGWVEGALRILPNLDLRIAGGEIPSPFVAGVVLPTAVFVVLGAWPFVEARITGDHAAHHLLDRPRDAPVRTALGVAGLSILIVFHWAGSHDLQALLLLVPVDTMTVAYRWVLVTVPPVAGATAYLLCRALTRAEQGRLGLSDEVAVELAESERAARRGAMTASEAREGSDAPGEVGP